MPTAEYWVSEAKTLRDIQRGGKTEYARRQAAACKISYDNWWKQVKSIGGYHSERKPRADKGESMATEAELRAVIGYAYTHNRATGKAIVSIDAAVERLKANGEINPELTVNTIRRQLKMRGWTHKKMKTDTPVQQLRSEFSNQVHQVDPSVALIFKFGKGASFSWEKSKHYKNKPDEMREALKRNLIWRYVLTDHASGFIRVHYIEAPGESWANYVEALTHFWRDPTSDRMPFFGVPRYLIADRVGAMGTSEIKSLMRNLDVELIIAQAARAKGQVENANNIIECSFESSLRGIAVESITQLNALAARWEMWFNSQKIHSRHGLTRSAAWLKFAQEKHLRHLPDANVLKLLIESRGLTRTVTPDKSLQFNNETYRLRHLSDINIGDKLEIRPAPYSPGDIFVLVEKLDGEKQQYQISPITKNELGFATDAALIGEAHVQTAPETPRDAMKKDALKAAYAQEKLEDAEKAKAKNKPLYPALDPLAHIKVEDVPHYMPRRGNEIVRAPELPRMNPMQSMIAVSNRLNRPLTAAEAEEVRGKFPQGCTEKEIEELVTVWNGQRRERPKLSAVR
jgi:hypothetical protein